MNHRSLGIAGICGALALACALPASAAKQIRTDSGNNWDSCSASNTASFPAGVLFNPFGGSGSFSFSTPLFTHTTCPEGTDVFDDEGNFVRTDYVTSALGSMQAGWIGQIPATGRGWENPDVRSEGDPETIDPLLGNRYFAQVLFFDLGAGDANESISYFNEQGFLDSKPNQPGAWEIAFNYDFDKFPTLGDGSDYPLDSLFASLSWNGSVYRADYDTLKDGQLYASFVFDGRDLHAPVGWTKNGPVASVPEPGALALFVMGLAGLIGAHFLRRRRPVASLTTA